MREQFDKYIDPYVSDVIPIEQIPVGQILSRLQQEPADPADILLPKSVNDDMLAEEYWSRPTMVPIAALATPNGNSGGTLTVPVSAYVPTERGRYAYLLLRVGGGVNAAGFVTSNVTIYPTYTPIFPAGQVERGDFGVNGVTLGGVNSGTVIVPLDDNEQFAYSTAVGHQTAKIAQIYLLGYISRKV